MPFDYRSIELPVKEAIPEVQQSLATDNTLILQAPPGAGKSTLLPLALLDAPWLEGKKILMLEPRRLAAKSISDRMASLLGEKSGETVGYRIRFEQKIGDNTKLEVLTEGILTRLLHSDNELSDVGLIIFDEFHERNIHADVALALCREAQQVLRQDLRILIMSATLDMSSLEKLLQAKSIESKGKQYPVEIKNVGDIDISLLPEMTARTIINASKEQEGDILVFFPGQGEIRRCEEILRRELKGFAIHPLYGQLPQGKQYAAIMPDKNGKRKVVLATSIAETSLTIEGIKVVVDTGFGRTSKFDPRSGLSRLVTVQISKDAADQRAGRAGRLSPGTCYRLWSKATEDRLESHRTPEIMEVDLANLAMDMIQWEIQNPAELAWLTPPPQGTYAQAIDMLEKLEAIEDGKITDHGLQIHRLPCHPRIAHMLIMAKNESADMLALATDVAPLLEERDPMDREKGIDINLRIELLRRQRGENRLGKKLSRIEKVSQSYRKLFNSEADNGPVDWYQTGLLLAYAFPERIACARPGNNAQFQLANGKLAMAGHKDDLAHEPWLAIANLDARDGMGKIFLASPLDPKDLRPMVKQQEVIKWDTKSGGLIASMDLRIGNIVLQSSPLPDPDEEHLMEAICDAVKSEGEKLLDFNDDVVQWQNRVLSLRRWNPADRWPDVSTSTLLLTNKEWLSPYLKDVKKPEDLKKINLLEVLNSHLKWELQQKLSELTPDRIKVPSGSAIKLEYFADGAPPVLAVRLQEVFGLETTPLLNEGKNSVLMHLLSPGFKPVQVTSDLKSFWDNTYFEVRKELKRRYPKHSWPDNPREEQAVRGVKRKN